MYSIWNFNAIEILRWSNNIITLKIIKKILLSQLKQFIVLGLHHIAGKIKTMKSRNLYHGSLLFIMIKHFKAPRFGQKLMLNLNG